MGITAIPASKTRLLFWLGLALAIPLVFLLMWSSRSNVVQADRHEPTANCFELDGVFSPCDGNPPLDPLAEWGDVAGNLFPTAVLRATQVAFDPGQPSELTHLALNYIELDRLTPLRPEEKAIVHWDTVENDVLVHVAAWIYADNTIKIFQNGVAVVDPLSGLTRAAEIIHHSGAVGFGRSPESPGVDTLIYELVVPLQGVTLSHAGGGLQPRPTALGQRCSSAAASATSSSSASATSSSSASATSTAASTSDP